MKFKKKHLAQAMILLSCGFTQTTNADVIIGSDLNSNNSANAEISALFSGNRGSRGGGDQSQQFGDALQGTERDDVIIGGLGIDVLFGNDGNDILIGGTEDFNAFNRDRAFGNAGEDIFIWTPGDGNDFFDGGPDTDVLIITLVGETRDNQGIEQPTPSFNVSPPNREGSQDFDGIALDENGLPILNVAGGPGFCEILSAKASNPGEQSLKDLNLDHLVRFSVRLNPTSATPERNAVERIDEVPADTGLRIAVHLKNTEFVVCGSREAGDIDIFDLRQPLIVKVDASQLPAKAAQLVFNSLIDPRSR